MMVHICYMKGKKQSNQDNDSVTCISGIQSIVIHCEDGTSSLYLDDNNLRDLVKVKLNDD